MWLSLVNVAPDGYLTWLLAVITVQMETIAVCDAFKNNVLYFANGTGAVDTYELGWQVDKVGQYYQNNN